MKLNLVVMTPGKQEGKSLPIELSQFLIGRDPQCHLRPASAAISKRHCAILVRDGKAFVRDFDSTNGTHVNDQPIKGEVELKNGDRLRVGPLIFGVQLQESALVNQPTPAPATGKKEPAAKVAEKKVPAANLSPAGGEAAPAASGAGAGSDDESIAAMLLSLQDDDSSGNPSGEVPEGSTVMEMMIPPEAGGPGEPGKEAEKDKKPTGTANTSSAAKAILEKYMKRPR